MGAYGLTLTDISFKESKETFEFVMQTTYSMSVYYKIVFLRCYLFILCGSLIMTDIKNSACLLPILLCFCVVFICNPLNERQDFESAMNSSLLIKLIATMGAGALLLLTKGKIVSEGKTISMSDSRTSKRKHF